ncbi:Hypothetical protein D9617_19g102740 [Elsinoe fawcettii]|nr:Hypothetical protein D9617_19g102740 [Elsinoe fawcettii]
MAQPTRSRNAWYEEEDIELWLDEPQTAFPDGMIVLLFQSYPRESLISDQGSLRHRGCFMRGVALNDSVRDSAVASCQTILNWCCQWLTRYDQIHLGFSDDYENTEPVRKYLRTTMQRSWITADPDQLRDRVIRLRTVLNEVFKAENQTLPNLLDYLAAQTPQFGFTIMPTDTCPCSATKTKQLDLIRQVTQISLPEAFSRSNGTQPQTFEDHVNAFFSPHTLTAETCTFCHNPVQRQNLLLDGLPHRLFTGPDYVRNMQSADDVFRSINVSAKCCVQYGDSETKEGTYHLFCLITRIVVGEEEQYDGLNGGVCERGVGFEVVKRAVEGGLVSAVFSTVEIIGRGSVEEVGMEDVTEEEWRVQRERNKRAAR